MIDDIFASYMQQCYRVLNTDISEQPTREQIKTYMAVIMPVKVFASESLARWHFGYVQHACKEAIMMLDKSSKEEQRNLKAFLRKLQGKEIVTENGPHFDVRELGGIADVLNKEWLRRLFFVQGNEPVSPMYRLDGNADGIFAAAAVMAMSKRNGIWPTITQEVSARDWALHILRRVA